MLRPHDGPRCNPHFISSGSMTGRSHAHPLFNHLKNEKSGLLGSSIKWNFTKFLVDRSGKVVGRYAPTVTPEGLRREIEALL